MSITPEQLRALADEWWEMCGDIHIPLIKAANRIAQLEAALEEIAQSSYAALAEDLEEIAQKALEQKETP